MAAHRSRMRQFGGLTPVPKESLSAAGIGQCFGGSFVDRQLQRIG